MTGLHDDTRTLRISAPVQSGNIHPLKILEVEDALNEAAQQDLVVPTSRLIGVNAPEWLHFKNMAPKIISPKPKFAKIK